MQHVWQDPWQDLPFKSYEPRVATRTDCQQLLIAIGTTRKFVFDESEILI